MSRGLKEERIRLLNEVERLTGELGEAQRQNRVLHVRIQEVPELPHRVPVLAVCMMLKDRNDHAPTAIGSQSEAVRVEYQAIAALRATLGETTPEERRAAERLWNKLAGEPDDDDTEIQ